MNDLDMNDDELITRLRSSLDELVAGAGLKNSAEAKRIICEGPGRTVIDSRGSGTGAFHFSINAAGSLSDGIHFNDTEYSADFDAVWEAKVADTDRAAATWYVVFSANEMVVITAKGNPLGLRQVQAQRLLHHHVFARRKTVQRHLAVEVVGNPDNHHLQLRLLQHLPVIREMMRRPKALREPLLKVFPAALLGRIVTIPYFPLSESMLAMIVKLQLNRIKKRVAENHKIPFEYSDEAVKLIEKQDKAKPFFLYFASLAPHAPYQAKKSDEARYADTIGGDGNNNMGDYRYPYAWTYRDWVIGALNLRATSRATASEWPERE